MKLSKEAWFGIIPGGVACKCPRRCGLASYKGCVLEPSDSKEGCPRIIQGGMAWCHPRRRGMVPSKEAWHGAIQGGVAWCHPKRHESKHNFIFVMTLK